VLCSYSQIIHKQEEKDKFYVVVLVHVVLNPEKNDNFGKYSKFLPEISGWWIHGNF